MKRYTLLLMGIGLVAQSVFAQAEKPKTKTTEKTTDKKEIVIEESKGGKTEKTVIVVNGDKVTINGKPAEEYKGKKHIVIDDDIIIDGNTVITPGAPRPPRPPRVAFSPGGNPRAFLGVVSEKTDKGVKLTEVVEESAAAKAGLKEGDIITKVNTTAISSEEQLSETIRQFKPEDVVDITYLRDGKEKKVKATLGKTSSSMVWSGDAFNEDFMKEFEIDMEGFEGPMALTIPRGIHSFNYSNDRPKFGMAVEDYADGDGVKVTSVDTASSAEKAGLRKDDIITAVNGEEVKNLDQLRSELNKARQASSIELKVLRAGKTETLTLRVPKKIKTADL